MLTTPIDLIGYDLIACTFGKIWLRLEFSRTIAGEEHKLWLETDNFVQRTKRHWVLARSPSNTQEALLPIYEFLESTVTNIIINTKHVTIEFANRDSLEITPDGESIDSLLKITDPESGHWLVVE
jgi:hypothetical protein